MQNMSFSSDRLVRHLVVCWLLMIPLVFFASYGNLWFQSVDHNNSTFEAYGAVVSQSRSLGNSLPGTAVFIIVTLIILSNLRSVIDLAFKDRVFISVAALALMSTLWSQSQTNALHSSLFLAMNTLLVFFLYRRFSPRQQLDLLLLLGTICLVFSLTLSIGFPRYGIDQGANVGAWRGMYPQKNMCAMATLYMLPAAFCLPIKSLFSAIFRGAYVMMSVFLIVMSQSRSSLISLVLLVTLLIGVKIISRFRSKERLVSLLIGTMAVLSLVAIAFSNSDRIAYALGKDPSLTGRIQIWRAVAEAISTHPLLGYGYQSFWSGYHGESAHISAALHWAVTSAHNGVLEVWLTLGVAGVVLVMYSMARALRDGFVCLLSGGSPYVQWCIYIACVTIIVSLDEGELTMPNNLTWVLFMLACVGLSEEARRIRLGSNQQQTPEVAKAYVAHLSSAQSDGTELLS